MRDRRVLVKIPRPRARPLPCQHALLFSCFKAQQILTIWTAGPSGEERAVCCGVPTRRLSMRQCYNLVLMELLVDR